jgi:hypothetical protein
MTKEALQQLCVAVYEVVNQGINQKLSVDAGSPNVIGPMAAAIVLVALKDLDSKEIVRALGLSLPRS